MTFRYHTGSNESPKLQSKSHSNGQQHEILLAVSAGNLTYFVEFL